MYAHSLPLTAKFHDWKGVNVLHLAHPCRTTKPYSLMHDRQPMRKQLLISCKDSVHQYLTAYIN